MNRRPNTSRWTRHLATAASLLGVIGCASPRGQLNAPLLSVQVPNWPAPRASNSDPRYPSARRTPRDATSRDGASRINSPRYAPPQASASRPPDRFARYGPTSEPRVSPEFEQRVARFTADPRPLIDPPTPIRDWRFIVLHHSGEDRGAFSSIDRYHRDVRGWDECGYHFVIGNGTESGDGEIEPSGRWAAQKHGAHTKDPNRPELNDDGLGICLVGNFNTAPPTLKQVESCRRLVSYLVVRCNVPIENVSTHGTLVPGHTECPGRLFPYERLMPRGAVAAR